MPILNSFVRMVLVGAFFYRISINQFRYKLYIRSQ